MDHRWAVLVDGEVLASCGAERVARATASRVRSTLQREALVARATERAHHLDRHPAGARDHVTGLTFVRSAATPTFTTSRTSGSVVQNDDESCGKVELGVLEPRRWT